MQTAVQTPAGFLVVSVDWEGGAATALAAPDNLVEAMEAATHRAETTDNADEVVYVLPSMTAFRPSRY